MNAMNVVTLSPHRFTPRDDTENNMLILGIMERAFKMSMV